MKIFKALHRNQSGLVSIVVTMILILLLGLIVLTYARVTNREQRQTLDRQLNTAAFYAAESGINDARDAINRVNAGETGVLEAQVRGGKDDCDPLEGYDPQIDAVGAIVSTCVMLDSAPPSLDYSITVGDSVVIPIEADDKSNLNRLAIHWQSTDDQANFSGCTISQTSPLWPASWPSSCSPGMLQIDLISIPRENPGNPNSPLRFDQVSGLIDDAATIFAAPRVSVSGGVNGSTVNYPDAKGFGRMGRASFADCSSSTSAAKPKHCSIEINVAPEVHRRTFYMRITPIYRSASVTICSPQCAHANSVRFSGAQTVIDSTGRASDVIRRVRVRVDSGSGGIGQSVGGVETRQTLCKRFRVVPPQAGSPGSVNYDAAADPRCLLN